MDNVAIVPGETVDKKTGQRSTGCLIYLFMGALLCLSVVDMLAAWGAVSILFWVIRGITRQVS